MPASMISEELGGSEKVNGRRIAIVVIGAMPGNTPTSVPTTAPIKQKRRWAGVNDTAKPVARLAIRSMPGAQTSPRPHRNWQAEHHDEQHHREGRQQQRGDGILAEANVIGRIA